MQTAGGRVLSAAEDPTMDELMSEYTIHCLRIAIGVALVLIVASCAVGYTIRGALA